MWWGRERGRLVRWSQDVQTSERWGAVRAGPVGGASAEGRFCAAHSPPVPVALGALARMARRPAESSASL